MLTQGVAFCHGIVMSFRDFMLIRGYIVASNRNGNVEGQADLLLRELARRFGAIPDTATERVRAAC